MVVVGLLMMGAIPVVEVAARAAGRWPLSQVETFLWTAISPLSAVVAVREDW